jgi:mono/diheme cytochrome c family protein
MKTAFNSGVAFGPTRKTAALLFLSACGSSNSSSPAAPDAALADVAPADGAPADVTHEEGLRIVMASGAVSKAVAGDAVALKVVRAAADGTVSNLPADATVVWNSPRVISALAPDTQAPALVPPSGSAPGAPPTAAWIENSFRADRSGDLANVLFILDPGTIANAVVLVSAKVSGTTPGGDVQTEIPVSPTPTGSASRGQALFGSGGANCSGCHGASGHGSTGMAPYTIAGQTYDYPAPGLNAEPGNVASDPEWTAALLAVAARADMDNHGVALRLPMVDWLSFPNRANGQVLSTQDFADIYAFLKTQTQ